MTYPHGRVRRAVNYKSLFCYLGELTLKCCWKYLSLFSTDAEGRRTLGTSARTGARRKVTKEEEEEEKEEVGGE